MKKRLNVKQKNCQDQSIVVLHNGLCEYHNDGEKIHIVYEESESDGRVEVHAINDYLEINRNGEANSRLTFRKHAKTIGVITSQYGSFEVMLYTRSLRISEQLIVIEYDVMSGAECNTLRFSWKINELFV